MPSRPDFAGAYLRQLLRWQQAMACRPVRVGPGPAAGPPSAVPPRVRALHLPPDPVPGSPQGEFCAVELDDGSVGISFALLEDSLNRLRAAQARLEIVGADALAVAQAYAGAAAGTAPAAERTLRRTLGFAAANALTHSLYRHAGWQPAESADSLGALDPQPGDHVGMIGLFTPLLERVLRRGVRLTVVELQADRVAEHPGWRVTLDAEALRGCNKVLATGALLLNDTLDAMLARCSNAQALVLVGPTMGCLPDELFARGVTLIGGTWVSDPQAYVDALRRGEARSAHARKVAVSATDYPGFEALLARCL